MIAECMIFFASFGAVNQLTPELLTEHKQCSSIIPSSMSQYSSIYVENFDEENLYTAMRIGWCESRGKQKAYRKSADDSGLMQFIPSTWNWIAEKFDAPEFDSKVLTYSGVPLRFLPEQDFYVREGFAYETIQFNAYYNIWMASKLAEDTYKKKNGETYTTWRDWNSSKFCWGDTKVFEKKWREEGF